MRSRAETERKRDALAYEARLQHNEDTIARLENDLRQRHNAQIENGALRETVASQKTALDLHLRYLVVLENVLRMLQR